MKYFKQLLLIFFLTLVGSFISAYLPLPIPGSVIGLLILFILLLTKVVKKEHLSEMSTFLIQHFSLFFIPAAVILINVAPEIGKKIGPFLIVVIASAILTFLSTIYTVKLVVYIQSKIKGEKCHASE